MKIQLRKWPLRIAVSCLLIVILLVGIVLNPLLLYANKTFEGSFTIYHQQKIGPSFILRLHDAEKLIKKSELYNPSVHLSICLNDGSYYPRIMYHIKGPAFGWGFGNIVTLMGNMYAPENYVELNGYKWNLTELLAHEAIHCYQFQKYGLLHSNPVAQVPQWKWEGYPEYIARSPRASLVKNISRLIAIENTDNNNWINFDDSTGTVIPYYKDWLLVQYCIDIKKMTYNGLLKDTTKEKMVIREMMNWYNQQSCN